MLQLSKYGEDSQMFHMVSGLKVNFHKSWVFGISEGDSQILVVRIF